ncbi:hypothetical protein [Bartonella sp. CB169]|uniref:hypothetical protein n=1 Tax=Bartonella sp. CB169 TaxID=3112257 RepID=UPI00300E3A92
MYPKITVEVLRLYLKRENNNLSGHITFDDFDSSMFFAPYFVDFPKIEGHLKAPSVKNRGGS